jgi:aldose 1-epimerase
MYWSMPHAKKCFFNINSLTCMYTYEKEPFGPYERHIISNKSAGARMVVVPDKGAGLMELRFGDDQLIDGYDTPEALTTNSGAKSMPLFPFPNRLAGGTYTWKGKTYEFFKTDSAGPNAIHGFGRETDFKVIQKQLGESTAMITCRYEDPGAHPGFPFPFSFDMEFRIDNSGDFELEMAFTNRSDAAIPVGFGWHPYFKVSERVDDALLQMPPCEKIEIDDHMIPTGKRRPFTHFGEAQPIGNFKLDNCFALKNEEGRVEVTLQNENRHLRYWQQTGPNKFNFIQLYTPDSRNALAIEPMTCNVDAFHNKEGLITLKPGETARARCGVHYRIGSLGH